MFQKLAAMAPAQFEERRQLADLAFLMQGITFTVYNDGRGTERLFPFDLTPRILPRSDADRRGERLEEVIGGQASHAWTEVFLPGMGWVGFDPTLGKAAGLRHVRVAYGRDYGDVPRVRGVYKGQAGRRLSVDVRVRPAVDDEGQEHLQNTAARPAEESVAQRPQQPQQQQ